MLGVFGGTFDPIHYGHLRTVSETAQAIGLEKVILIPCGTPAHRSKPHASSAHRLNMVRLAVNNDPLFVVDDREITSPDPCRTVPTLTALHRDWPDRTFCLIIGQDSFLTLPHWYQWQRLFELGHLVVMSRPGVAEEPVDEVWQYGRPCRSARDLAQAPYGGILRAGVTHQPISASAVRLALVEGRPVGHLIPQVVERYINEHRLYI